MKQDICSHLESWSDTALVLLNMLSTPNRPWRTSMWYVSPLDLSRLYDRPLNRSLLFRTSIYTPLCSRGRVWGVVYPLPEVCLWGGGRLVGLFFLVQEKAVVWHHLLFLSGDCHSPLHWAWPWKTIEILTHPGMTKRGGERARESKKLTWDRTQNNYG